MRRPWIVMLTSFALVLGLGGLAFAAGGVPFIDDGTDTATADNWEAELPDFESDKVEPTDETDEPVKDGRIDDEPVFDKPVEKDAESDVVESDEKKEPDHEDEVKDEPKAEPPTLKILHPENGAKVDDEKMVFEGTTTPGARVFAGPWEADVNADGVWRIVLILDAGTQTAKFHAESDGGVAEAAVTVTRIVPDVPKEEPKEEEKPKEDEHQYELVAHQVYGVCEEALPYDVFWGETKPGATVLVWSEYGSAETVAGPEGGWELRVDFPEAPYGVEFQVKVKSIEQIRYFGFTSYGNPPDGGDGGGEGA